MNSGLTWVFAYGSNMHRGDLCRWLTANGYPGEGPVETHAAILNDYKLVWNYHSRSRNAAAANVNPAEGAKVYGVVLRVSAETLAGIDEKEGHPKRYSRNPVPRTCHLLHGGAAIDAWVYVVQPAYQETKIQRPRADYIRLMTEAAREYDFPTTYIDDLLGLETKPYPEDSTD